MRKELKIIGSRDRHVFTATFIRFGFRDGYKGPVKTNLMKDCSLEKTDEDMYYNSEWDYTCEESELEPEDKNDPDVHKVYEAGMYYIYSN